MKFQTAACHWVCGLALLAGLGLFPFAFAGAQASSLVAGCVVDERGQPVSAARVLAQGTLLEARTTDDGCFLVGVQLGRRLLTVRKVGFQSLSLSVQVDGGSKDIGTLRLVSALTELNRLVVSASASSPLDISVTPEALRQQPALGERDVFRSLQFLPGVAQPNDVLGRSHLAGGASDEHAITLNGHPLQAPFHVNSVFGAFNPAALDRVSVVMHHLTPDSFDRVSGSIDLETRQSGPTARREVQVGVLSLGGTVVQPRLVGSTDLLVSARTSYLDGLLRSFGVGDGAGSDDVRVPSFRDALLTARTRWSSRWESEVVLFHTRDRWNDNGAASGASPRWGENLVGVTTRFNADRWRSSLRISRNVALVEQRRVVGATNIGAPSLSPPAADAELSTERIELDQQWLSTQFITEFRAPKWSVTLGAGVDAREHRNVWAGNSARNRLLEQLPIAGKYEMSQTLASTFGSAKRVLGEGGATLSFGTRVSRVGTSNWVAPRLDVRMPVSRQLVVEAALDRRHQFDAIAAEPIEGTLTQPVFFLSTPRSANVAALSASWSPGNNFGPSRMHFTATTFAKQYTRSPVLPVDTLAPQVMIGSRPLPDVTSWTPPFNRVDGQAVGATLGFDVSSGRGWLLQGSYTLQRVRDERSGPLRPTAWDAPHQLAGLLGVPLGMRWQFIVATQARSGPRVTPTETVLLLPTPEGFVRRPVPGALNVGQLSAFYRTDVGIQKTWKRSGVDWMMSAQVINVFARENRVRDDNARGLPLIPSLSFEVRW